MKKIITILLISIILPAYSANMPYAMKPASKPSGGITSNSRLILNTQSGIKARIDSMQKMHAGTNTNIPVKPGFEIKNLYQDGKPMPPNAQTPKPGVNPNFYVPHVYGFRRYNDEPDKIEVNNTYNIYQNSTNKEEEKVKKEEKPTIKEKTQKEKDNEERNKLRKKYRSILSNKTMDNKVMCSKMEKQFPNADYDELDRLLNNILRLNCNINDYRSY